MGGILLAMRGQGRHHQNRSTGYEDGTNTSVYTLDTPANGGGPTCTTTNPATGTKCVKELGSGSYQYTQANFATTSTTFRVRYYFAQDIALTADGIDFEIHSDTSSGGSTNRALQVVRKSTGVLRVLDNTGATVHRLAPL